MKCEICDRESRQVYRAATSQDGIWFAASVPRGEGRGWLVPFWPFLMPALVTEFLAAPSRSMVGYEIRTCGDAICIWRAKHHGVPGRLYEAQAA